MRNKLITITTTLLYLAFANPVLAQTPTSTPSATQTPTPVTTLPDAGISFPTIIFGITAISLITLGIVLFNKNTSRI